MKPKLPLSISELLGQQTRRLGALQAGVERARTTLIQVQEALPAELAQTVHSASIDEAGQLTVLVESGAYASRLRYALPDLLPKVVDAAGKPVKAAKVQVRPRSTVRS